MVFGTRKLDKDKIADGLAEVLPAAFGYAMNEGLAMSGPPFVRYLEQSPAFITVEAVTVHKGPYETLAEAHIALDRWMAEQGVSPAGPPWEVYLTDPAEVSDPADWLTEVVWPTTSG